MSLQVKINLNSLLMINEQLNECISLAATEFETFLADRSSTASLEASINAIEQVAGTFKLLEFAGASALAEEMAALGRVMADPETKTSDAMVESYTHNLFVLPRYMEFASQQQYSLPILLIPNINQMRLSRRETLLPEYFFYEGEIPPLKTTSGELANGAQLIATTKRLSTMFQAGLVGAIKSDGKALHHYQLLQRASERMQGLLGDHPCSSQWRLANGFISALGEGSLSLTMNRKRMLGDLEKSLRQIAAQGDSALHSNDDLAKSMAFAVALAGSEIDTVKALQTELGLAGIDFTDAELSAQRAVMQGPTADTMSSVISVLKDELRTCKDILEIAAQNDGIDSDELKTLQEQLQRTADTLLILNLSGPQQLIHEHIHTMQQWSEHGAMVGNRKDFLAIADVVLFVDSALSALQRKEVTVAQLNEADEQSRAEIVGRWHLAQAASVVLEEAQAGISLAKRAITSYVDSNFDSAHIANVATTLNMVRGGLHVLNYDRGARILKACGDFINSHINQTDNGGQRHQLLATLADALISLEYYLGELIVGGEINDKVLDVAEESLAALGYKVEQQP